jgi:hypothetical protein
MGIPAVGCASNSPLSPTPRPPRQILEAMWDDSVALCLTPQAFSNINPKADIFNNINQQVGGAAAGTWELGAGGGQVISGWRRGAGACGGRGLGAGGRRGPG